MKLLNDCGEGNEGTIIFASTLKTYRNQDMEFQAPYWREDSNCIVKVWDEIVIADLNC